MCQRSPVLRPGAQSLWSCEGTLTLITLQQNRASSSGFSCHPRMGVVRDAVQGQSAGVLVVAITGQQPVSTLHLPQSPSLALGDRWGHTSPTFSQPPHTVPGGLRAILEIASRLGRGLWTTARKTARMPLVQPRCAAPRQNPEFHSVCDCPKFRRPAGPQGRT